MDRQIQAIRKLVTGPHSIYRYNGSQYPSEKQQRYLTSYSTVYKILSNQKQPDRVFQQQIFKNINNMHVIVHGLLYLSLLNPQMHRQVFNHLQLFRADAMKAYADCVENLLKEDFQNLKEESTQLFPEIYRDLSKYRMLTEDMVVSLLKTINPVQIYQKHLNYTWKVIEMFMELGRETQTIRGFGRYLFLKLLKLLTILYVLVEEEGLNEFRQDCLRNVLRLWKADPRECAYCGNEVFRYFQQLIPYINRFMQQYKSLYNQHQKSILYLSPLEKQKILGINLSSKVTHILHFMADCTPQQMSYQFNWMYREYEESKTFDFVVIDMLRYVLRVIMKESKFFMIDRIVSYCCGKPVLFQYVRQAVFFDWFIYQPLSDDRICDLAAPGLRVLQIFRVSTRPQIAQKMLQYILQQHLRSGQGVATKIKQNLKRIFQLGQRRSLLHLTQLLQQPSISPQIRKQLSKLMATVIAPSSDYNPFTDQHANASEPSSPELNRNMTQNWEEENYGNEIKDESLLSDYLELAVEKEYAEETGNRLVAVMEKPNKDTYAQLMEAVMGLVKKASASRKEELFKMFNSETAKVTYVVFQSHFQEFWVVDRDANIIGYLVEKLHSCWGPMTQQQKFFRMLVKELGKFFKVVPFAIYYIFLFKIGSQRAHARQMSSFFLEGSSTGQMVSGFKLLIQDAGKLTELSQRALTYNIRF